MYSDKDKLYLQTKDMPTLKNKINEAIELSRKLTTVLNDLESYNLTFEIKKEGEEMTHNEFQENQELERIKLTYYELPNLIHQILQIRLMPSMSAKTFLESDIEEIKKITNAECESALSYFEKLIKT